MNFTIFLFDQRAAVYQKTDEGYSNFKIKGESIYELSTDRRAVDVLPDYILSSNHHGVGRLEVYKLDWHENEFEEWRQKLPGTDILFLDLNVFELFRSDMLQEKEDIFQRGLSQLHRAELELEKVREELSLANEKLAEMDELKNQNDQMLNQKKIKDNQPKQRFGKIVFFEAINYSLKGYRFIGIKIMLNSGFKVQSDENIAKLLFERTIVTGFYGGGSKGKKFMYLKSPRSGYIQWLSTKENSVIPKSSFAFKDSVNKIALAVITDNRNVDRTALHQYVKDFCSNARNEE